MREKNNKKNYNSTGVNVKKNNKKSNLRVRIYIILLVLFVAIIIFGSIYFKVNKLKNIFINDENKYIVELKNSDETYCYIGDNIKNVSWVKAIDSKCVLGTKGTYLYIKNKFGVIARYDNNDIGKVTNLSVVNELVYLAIGGSEKIEYNYEVLGKVNGNISFISENPSIATVDNDGVITGISSGETRIIVKYVDRESIVNVVVTDKIITYGDMYEYNRSYLGCGMYSKEDNDLLDKILESRINAAGYKTRAGVLAAVRFLMLEFPYRISYFSENGRLHPYGAGAKIDGEGRYYHKGLYLDESRFDVIDVSMHGPATWGCEMYSVPSEGIRKNGFDCSGFISWIIHQAGYENEDLGAGVSSIPDMTDLGKMYRLTDAVSNKTIKAGDLLSGHGSDGGHIAMIAGIKDDKYYVAESLWYAAPNNGALIKEYTSESIVGNFYWHVDMEEYYGENGKYREFWK